MPTPILYTAELDVPETDIEAFSHWYAYRHTPDLYQVGFLTCTCYRVLDGDMNLFDLYEAPGWEIFDRPGYLAMRGRDPYMAPLMEKRRNKAHTVYEQRLIAPASLEPCLDADWITVARFHAPPEADEAIAAGLTADVPRLTGLGASRIRYAHRTKDHPRNPTFRPRCMVVVEWPDRPPSALDPTARFSGSVSELTVFTGVRIYPWPDRPA